VSTAATGNVDIAPTLLQLTGLPVPRSMAGRVITEGLRSGSVVDTARAWRTTETVKSADGGYELTFHYTVVADRRYFDYTEVKRR
jgi:arylsulfatase A-like enzyme